MELGVERSLPPLSANKPSALGNNTGYLNISNGDHGNETDNATHLPHQQKSLLDPDETAYTNLIQQYLSLLCYENATFLAERLVAHRPRSENASYLLACCYYQSGSPKRARSVLLSRWLGRTSGSRPSRTHERDEGEASSAVERIRSAARYLLSKCSFELGMYGEAEEALLRDCRERFAKIISNGGALKIRGNMNEAIDKWIMQTTPCPIPNGPAGLYLLGNICRKSNRRQRAIEYYRLSLKLDPLMWVSYEAMCELGGPLGDSDEVDDPNEIFGVEAPILSPRNKTTDIGPASVLPFAHGGRPNPTGENTTFDEPSRSFKISRYGTPSTPYESFDRIRLGADFLHNNSRLFTDGQHEDTSDAHQHFHRPATASTILSRVRERSGRLPQTNLFNTPSMTPPHTSKSSRSDTHGSALATPNNSETIAPSAIRDSSIIDRARQVASRLYYEPSPEATPPNSFSIPLMISPSNKLAQRKNVSRRWRVGSNIKEDIAAVDDFPASSVHGVHSRAEFSLTSTPPTTPCSAPSPFHAGLSSVKGEKRSLFSTSHIVSTKRSGGEKEKHHDQQHDEIVPGSHNDAVGMDLDPLAEKKSVEKILELLCAIGAAYKFLCQYRSHDALELFRELPPTQIATGWVQHQIGKAYFEMSDYQNALRALENMQHIEPHRMKGLDILSTALWHLKKEVELSDLAQRAVDFDRMAPEAWFVVGNCFSFQKEHETAITFFRRSIQLDPTYTYAHTLCGHEYMSNEDFEKAVACYRDAIRVDCRHYNAWYGLGAIYYRQEKYDLAEYHFQRALDINHQSSVLYCHLGMAQSSNGKTFEALETIAGAFRLDPRNPQAHYQRATIFMSLDRPQEALVELEKVRSAAPREASVHFSMGKVLKRLGHPEKAMRCFLTALDLDPKDNNLIKAAMDRLDEPDVEDEVSMF